MIKLNIQLFAADVIKDSENCSMTLYKEHYTAKGILYKAIVKIHSEFFIKDESSLDGVPSWYDRLAIAKIYNDTISINLLTSNNYIWDKINGDLYVEIPENGIWHAQIWESINANNYYITSPITISNLIPKVDSTKTIQKTTEIITQQTGEPEKVGVIKMFSGSVPPLGWMLCNGAAISRIKYSKLFNVIGTTYGSGDGETTFNLPNLKGKTVVGLDETDNDFKTLGKIGGEKTHKLTIQEMPSHFHANEYTFEDTPGTGWSYRVRRGGSEGTTDGSRDGLTGGNQAHNNLQPYIVLNYIIKVVETKNLQAQVVDSLEGDSTSASPSVRAVKSAISENYEQISNMNNFSSEERIIGTWFGKPLYSKTLYRSKLINGKEETVNHGIANVDKIWGNPSKSFAIWADGKINNLTFTNDTSYEISIFFYDFTPTHFKLKSGYDRSELSGYITLEYTKTTD